MNPEYELIPMRSVLCPKAYQIILNLDQEAAHKTLYPYMERIELQDVESIVFWVGDP